MTDAMVRRKKMESMGILAELKRRHVFRVSLAYAAVAWLLIEVSATTFPMLRLPDWSPTLVLMLLLIGFPFAVIFAWVYEITPEGIKRDTEDSEKTAGDRRTATGAPIAETVSEQSIAVLPFVNMSDDASNEYFSDGLSEELLNLLARIPDLHVAARTSSC
jgi:adenylate cyclase